MSAEHRHIPEPGELVYPPRSSWAPAIFAFALALAVCGIFAEGFMVRGWVYSIIAGIVALFAFRSMAREAIRDYFRLPRKQHVRGAVLPVEQISPPRP
jgi:energy-coupling factor transporter transmembrane protein EcfT